MMGRSESNSGADFFPNGSYSELPEHNVSVSAYYLDRHEVTVGRFRRFLLEGEWIPLEGSGEHLHISGTGWQSDWNSRIPTAITGAGSWEGMLACDTGLQTWTTDATGNETLPINCVSWYAAFAFCIWDGGRLPTDAEWEYAAAGGNEERLYPWGSEKPDGSQVAGYISPVGNRCGGGRWGHLDMGGNVQEWTLDWTNWNWYQLDEASGQDVCNLTPGDFGDAHYRRGGVFASYVDESALRVVQKYTDRAETYSGYVGFRCARDRR
jgi:formylglycine-generating enzyme required for sulfatase activity